MSLYGKVIAAGCSLAAAALPSGRSGFAAEPNSAAKQPRFGSAISHAHQDHVGSSRSSSATAPCAPSACCSSIPTLAFPQGATDAIDAAPDAARGVARALGEEPLPPDTDRATLDEFLSDAANLGPTTAR